MGIENEGTAPQKAPNPLSIQQFDAVISSVSNQIAELLEAGENDQVPLLLSITEAMMEQKAEKIDSIVRFLLFIEFQIEAAKAEALVFRDQAWKLEIARDKLRVHIQNYIDNNLPADNRILAGKACKLFTSENAQPSLLIPDENIIPNEFFSYELTIRIPAAAEKVREAIGTIAEFVKEFSPAGSSVDVRLDQSGAYKKVLDSTRVRQHLEATSEPWGKVGKGRHLRTKPSLVAARKAALVKT